MTRAILPPGCLILLLLAGAATAQSLEVREGSPLRFERLHVTATVEESVALVDVDQTFRNDTDRVQEGIYRFQLPADAVVHSFSLWIAGREKKGQVFEGRFARRVYDSIVRSKRDPAILEQKGWRSFQVSVFPIPKRDTVRLRLIYAHVLPDDLGLQTFEVPVIEGGSRIGECSFTATIRERRELALAECLSHKGATVTRDGGHAEVRWAAEGYTPTGPFVVRILPRAQGIDLSILTHRDVGESDGFFLIRVLPHLPKAEPVPRDVVFVFDRSGSMQGKKIEQARFALLRGLDSLREGDRFGVISFASDILSLDEGNLLPVGPENLERARTTARRLEASGGTNIDLALKRALELRDGSKGRLFVLVFLTDGEPTMGEKRPQKIIANYREASSGAVRLFALGVGRGAKDFLLTHLAEGSRGAATYVREGDSLEIPLSALYRKVGSPLMLAPEITVEGVEVHGLVPTPLPDLFRDDALVLAGRYKAGGKATLKLTGTFCGKALEVSIPADFAEEPTERPHVAQLWAKRRIDRLIDDLRIHGQVTEIRQSIIDLGVKHQIVTPYTSYLVVEDGFRMPEPRATARSRPIRSRPSHIVDPGGGIRFRGPTGEVPPSMRMPARPPPSEGGTPTPPPDEGGWVDDGSPAPVMPGGGLVVGRVRARPGGSGNGAGAATGSGRKRAGPPPITFDTWEFWWGYNKDELLGLRSGLIGRTLAEDVMVKRVLPLLEAIADDRNIHFHIRQQAILALGKLGSTRPGVTERIAKRLVQAVDGDGIRGDVRECAVLALGLLQSRHESIVDALLVKLADDKDESPRIRAHAALVLGLLRIGGEHPRYDVVIEAFRSILKTSKDIDLRVSVIMAMGLSGDASLVPELSTMVRDRRASKLEVSDLEAAHAAEALGRILAESPALATQDLVDVLKPTMVNAMTSTARSSAIAYGRFGARVGVDPKVLENMVSVLEFIVKKGENQAANFALISLGRIGGACGDSKLRTRILGLLKMGMRKGPYTAKPFAALALGLMGRSLPAESREAIRFEFREFRGNPRNRGGHAIALGLLRDRKSTPGLQAVLADMRADKRLRGACALALGMINDPKAAEVLGAVLEKKSSRDLRVDTTMAVGLVDPGRASPILLRLLRRPRSSLYVQTGCAAGLAQIGDPASIEKLIALFEDESVQDLNRATAVATLGILADEREVPILRRLTTDVNYRALTRTFAGVLAELQ
jgi:HEAT repeat protein/uncharacterized protein YegL